MLAFLKNLTLGQKLAIFICVMGVITSGGNATELVNLFGPVAAKWIISAANLSMSVVSGCMTIILGQGGQIAAVQAMPGVERVLVNEKANKTLAALAVDPAMSKIEAMPAAEAVVQATANAAS